MWLQAANKLKFWEPSLSSSSGKLISKMSVLKIQFSKRWAWDGSQNLTFRCPCIISIFVLIYFQRDAILHSLFISGKLLYMFRVVSSPIIRSTYNYLQYLVLVNHYCCLPMLWESWSWYECGVGIVPICDDCHALLVPCISTVIQ